VSNCPCPDANASHKACFASELVIAATINCHESDMACCGCTVKHTEKFGHIILLKLLDSRGLFLPVYIGETRSCACLLSYASAPASSAGPGQMCLECLVASHPGAFLRVVLRAPLERRVVPLAVQGTASLMHWSRSCRTGHRCVQSTSVLC
jgi:hypothetical protein